MVKEKRDNQNNQSKAPSPTTASPSSGAGPGGPSTTATATTPTTSSSSPNINKSPVQIKEEIEDSHENNARREESPKPTGNNNIKIENQQLPSPPNEGDLNNERKNDLNDELLHLEDMKTDQIKDEEDGEGQNSSNNNLPNVMGGGGRLNSPHPGEANMGNQMPPNPTSKQTNSMEYMQQQSQIFVFSTSLANKGAEAVLNGHFQSIIGYHCAQPGTKKFLEKHPLKLAQFARQNQTHWFNNLPAMKPGKNMRQNNKPMLQPPMTNPEQLGFPGSMPNSSLEDEMMGPNNPDLMQWDNNQRMLPNGIESNPLMSDHDVENIVSGGNNPSNVVSPNHLPPGADPTSPNSFMNSMQPSLQGVKVPDENLTPQQRQHREEQLATIRRMQKIFFPEQTGNPNEMMQQQQQNPQNPMENPAQRNMCRPPQNPGPGPGPGQHPGDNNMMNEMNFQNNVPLNNMGMPCGMNPKGMMPENNPNFSQMEWRQRQFQNFEKNKRTQQQQMEMMANNPQNRNNMMGNNNNNNNNSNNMSNIRPQGGQGPPPPYHLTPRSASVPIALQSPNPASPNNPTSNLSLPSPRGGGNNSTLNSPGDPAVINSQSSRSYSKHLSNNSGLSPSSQNSPVVRPMTHSNPSTPITSHLSPNANLELNATPNGKEPNLMPVPSPQQIQYLNTFEGQELIIQKQPNANLKDNSNSNSATNDSMDKNAVPSANINPAEQRQTDNTGPSPQRSRTSSTSGPENNNNSSQNAAQNNSNSSNSNNNSNSNSENVPQHFPSTSPSINLSPSTMNPGGVKMGNFMDVSPNAKTNSPAPPGPPRVDNIPLNPNSTVTGNAKVSHFDPISSLAQMSQQLTSSVASSLNGGHIGCSSGMMGGFNNHGMEQMPGPGMMPGMEGMQGGPMECGMMGGGMPPGGPGGYGGGMMGQMPMGNGPNNMPRSMSPKMPMGNYHGVPSLSPKLPMGMGYHGGPPQRMMGRGPMPGNNPPGGPYNGANVQVKASAPNTIQYLPARPQIGNQNPRGPPSLEFLHRFANPMQGMENKMPNQGNMPYYNQQQVPTSGPPNASGSPNMGGVMGPGPGPDGNNMQEGMGMPPMMNMGGPMGGPMGNPMMMGQQGMMMRGIRPNQGPNMLRLQNMGHFNGPQNNNEAMFGPGGPGGPPNMFGPGGPKMEQMGQPPNGGNPDCPPNGPQFNKSPFVGPSTTDPNYAQQYHNFQQQLYATNTRNQLGNPQGMAGNVGGNNVNVSNPNQPFFVPK